MISFVFSHNSIMMAVRTLENLTDFHWCLAVTFGWL